MFYWLQHQDYRAFHMRVERILILCLTALDITCDFYRMIYFKSIWPKGLTTQRWWSSSTTFQIPWVQNVSHRLSSCAGCFSPNMLIGRRPLPLERANFLILPTALILLRSTSLRFLFQCVQVGGEEGVSVCVSVPVPDWFQWSGEASSILSCYITTYC